MSGRTGSGKRIAIVDTGVHAGHPHIGEIHQAAAFDEAGTEHRDVMDRLGHGTAVAAAIHEKAPAAVIYIVKVFDRSLTTTGRALAAGIRWAVAQQVDLINLSLGTTNTEHRAVLSDVVAEATRAGSVIVAAAPTDEHAWLPGGIPGVIGVDLDWSCPREEGQLIAADNGDVRVRASGYPRPIPGVPPDRNLKGHSFAVANATGLLAHLRFDRGTFQY